MNNEEMKKIMLEDPANSLKINEKNELINKMSELFCNMVDKVKPREDLELKKKSITSIEPPFISKRTYEDKTKQAVMDNVYNYLMSTRDIDKHYGNGNVVAKIIIEIAERLIDKLPLKHFVGIQPMQGPVGLMYSLQYQYAEKENWSEDESKSVGVMDKTAGKKVTLNVISSAIEARSRKFDGIELIIEATMDEQMSAEQQDELTNKFLDEISDKMALNIYREIKNDISSIAFKIKGTLEINPSVTAQHLCIEINRAGNEIARLTRRGAGNYVIASKPLYNILKTIGSDSFVKATEEKEDYGFVKFMGTLHGTIKVYCDLEMPAEKLLVGYKGNGGGETDAGYFYCPYVPVMSTGIVINPLTFEPIVTFMTRYGKQSGQPSDVFSTKNTDGSSSETIYKKSSNYFAELTFDNVYEVYEMISEMKSLEKVKADEDVVGLFDEAMNTID